MHRVFGRSLTGSVSRRAIISRPTQRWFARSSNPWKDHGVGSQGRIVYTDKYSEKLQKLAEKQGVTVEELVTRSKEKAEREKKERLARTEQLDQVTTTSARGYASADVAAENGGDVHIEKPAAPRPAIRKDSSPVKPLSTILNFDRLFGEPHTADQVATLWNAYHSSKSGGTGRGYLSAAIPVDKEDAQLAESDKPIDGPVQTPVEFFYMQWDFHGSPPDPMSRNDPFTAARPSNLPPTSTILFTPLVEFQTHKSFATPHLVVTHYTDLAQSHGLVLFRGEITPRSAQGAGNQVSYHLEQHHAQVLALGVQKFYLWSSDNNERKELLKAFHERPEDFKWEHLLRLSATTP
ncbi:hypothetical protein EIP91_006206 [Steccherinum ochraceum]|uniref:ATP synthase mitochondrial F1 complex assembly factor 1 n=1 Tax=Steccherinum ochraceum TaxID=92696 RepID=A0A4R0R8U9_9APHY|nr:hypothetical protein EIP91_006206 [Steccherinum ochraceum]